MFAGRALATPVASIISGGIESPSAIHVGANARSEFAVISV